MKFMCYCSVWSDDVADFLAIRWNGAVRRFGSGRRCCSGPSSAVINTSTWPDHQAEQEALLHAAASTGHLPRAQPTDDPHDDERLNSSAATFPAGGYLRLHWRKSESTARLEVNYRGAFVEAERLDELISVREARGFTLIRG